MTDRSGTPAGPDDETVAGRPAADESGADSGYLPGHVLAGRFRIVTRVGRGGMGEVYRADDLKLGQTVALKFLAGHGAAATVAEVRAARGIAHPNVCRVYDVGEADGRPFLSMEFIDGEDLGALLKRIGRFPRERALELARQLCAGLAAIHDGGLVHRDLKPGNVMIDGRGRVRITDFGIAVDAGARTSGWAGTPAYMAPEQLAGEPATARSDIYALGLVLFELFAGRPAFVADDLATLQKQKRAADPPSLSSSLRDADPVVEEAIQRCLAPNPAQRPPTARAVAALLPGGDPLAVALAAGETPSPDVVAASGGVGALRPLVAWLLLAGVLAALGAGTWLFSRGTVIGRHPPPKPVAVLVEKAREALAAAGHAAPRVDHYHEFGASDRALWALRSESSGPAAFPDAGAYYALRYRESPVRLWYGGQQGFLGFRLPPVEIAGMANVVVDGAGRLESLEVVPPQVGMAESPAASADVDWAPLLALTGFDAGALRPVEPRRLPRHFADGRRAWSVEGAEPGPVTIEAASYRGTPVWFEVAGPWTVADRMPRPERDDTPGAAAATVAQVSFIIAVIVTTTVLGVRNSRAGRCDKRGALRVAIVVALIDALQSVFAVDTLGGPNRLPALLYYLFSAALARGALIGLSYLALEPYVRRAWPDVLVAWTRLLGGRLTDPRLGRELLAGTLIGLLTQLIPASAYAFGFEQASIGEFQQGVTKLAGAGNTVVRVLENLMDAGAVIFAVLCLLAAAAAVLRRRAVAATSVLLVVAVLVALSNRGGGATPGFALGAGVTVAVTLAIVLFRVGLVGSLMYFFVGGWLLAPPLQEAWFAPQALLATAFVAAPAVYGAIIAARPRR